MAMKCRTKFKWTIGVWQMGFNSTVPLACRFDDQWKEGNVEEKKRGFVFVFQNDEGAITPDLRYWNFRHTSSDCSCSRRGCREGRASGRSCSVWRSCSRQRRTEPAALALGKVSTVGRTAPTAESSTSTGRRPFASTSSGWSSMKTRRPPMQSHSALLTSSAGSICCPCSLASAATDRWCVSTRDKTRNGFISIPSTLKHGTGVSQGFHNSSRVKKRDSS